MYKPFCEYHPDQNQDEVAKGSTLDRHARGADVLVQYAIAGEDNSSFSVVNIFHIQPPLKLLILPDKYVHKMVLIQYDVLAQSQGFAQSQ